MEMIPLKSEPAMYYHCTKDKLNSILADYVDESLFSSTDLFIKHSEKILDRLDSKPPKFYKFEFFGV